MEDNITVEIIRSNSKGITYKIYDLTHNCLYCHSDTEVSLYNIKRTYKKWSATDYNPYNMLSKNEQDKIDGGLKRRLN